MTSNPETSVLTTGLVLCGGRGQRLGGIDKGLHDVGGRALVEYVFERIAPQVAAIIVSANRNRSRYGSYGYPVVSDGADDFRGPLAGVLAGLGACGTPWLVSVPCDAPETPDDLVARLVGAAVADDSEIACAVDGERMQPTFCAYHSSLAEPLADYLNGGGRKIDRFLFSRRIVQVSFAGREREFANLNTDDDVRRFETAAGATGKAG